MRPVSLVLIISLLASCGARPDVGTSTHQILNNEFQLTLRGNRAETVRSSLVVALSFQPIALKAAYAAEVASGCRAAWVQGDLDQQQIGLSCDGRQPPQMPVKTGAHCVLHNYATRASIRETDMTCNRL